MGRVKCDHIKRLITLTSDNIKRIFLCIGKTYLKVPNILQQPLIVHPKQSMAEHGIYLAQLCSGLNGAVIHKN
jgi:hypothetical protein